MSMDTWKQKLDIALDRVSRDLVDLGAAVVDFVNRLSLVEQGLMGGLGLLMLFYLVLPGGRGNGAGNPGGKYFAGVLLIFIAVGVFAGLMMAGHIRF